MYFQISKIVRQEGIEVVIINHALPVGYIALLIKKFKKIPYLVCSHGTDVLAGTSTRWKTKMITMVSRGAEELIFNSQSLQRRFLRTLPEFEAKSMVLYPCPDPNLSQPPSLKEIDNLKQQYALEGKKVILSVSRLDDGKGFPHLIRILPKVLEKVPNLVWFLVGDGPKRKKILDLIRENSLQNVVRYIGEIPHKEVKKYYYLADLFVLLTHPDGGKEEGLGLVFLEAAATGLPVVAGQSGGVGEAVVHTQTGLVIDVYQNLAQIGDSIVELLKNEKYSKQLGSEAKLRIQSQFQWEHQIKKLDRWIQ